MSRASVAQGCGAKITSPFLHHYGACPIFPEQLLSIMQTSPSPQRPSVPCESDPPTLYRPRPPPAPLPGGHTVPVAEDDRGQFGKLPPQALQICVLATPRVLKKVRPATFLHFAFSRLSFLTLAPPPRPLHTASHSSMCSETEMIETD